jgi:acetylornithine deacetylase/succinyl-diaminopimelate desuccinylase-like protein
MHQKDESLPIDELILGTAVYAHALAALVFGHENP